MTAGIFANHGVWTGKTRGASSKNPKGYYENSRFQAWVMRNVAEGTPLNAKAKVADYHPGFTDQVHSILSKEGYDGGPWLFKHGVLAWKLWRDFDPHWICVRRQNVSMSVRDLIRPVPGVTFQQIVDTCTREMDTLRDEHDGVDVFADDVVRGDYSSLERAFDACGLTFDPKIADDFVEPSYWHH